MWKRLIRSSAHSHVLGHFLGRFPASRVCAAVSLAALGGVLIGAGNSENLLRTGFEQAIRNNAGTQAAQSGRASSSQIARIPVSGSEEFWLSALAHDGIKPVSKSVVIGDRISMTLGGVETSLEVASVSEFDPKTTEIDTRARSVRLVLVTARDTKDSGARPVRFVMEIETAVEPAVSALPAKTL